jgi:hypothetical protein
LQYILLILFCLKRQFIAESQNLIKSNFLTAFLKCLRNCNEVFGQWTNRYPKIANVSHHVYLEGYNLPTLNQGATDPAVSPDGKTLAIAARGWIWLMDTNDARSETPDKKRRD